MATPIKRLKIDLRSLDKSHFFEGKEHATKTMTVGSKTVPYRPLYADLTLWDSGKVSEYGDDGFMSQDVGKEARERGEKGPIVGNSKPIKTQTPATPRAPAPAPRNDFADDSEVPF
jgi:hypothetical protein